MIIGLFTMIKDEDKVNSDALKFKEEYELLNGKYDEETNVTLDNMDIDKNNPFKYLKDEEVLEKLTDGTNIIYFGYPEDGFSRRAVEVLLEFAKQKKIDTIYYYNFLNLREIYENNSDEEKVKLYEDIINILDKYLTDTYTEGIRSGIKRLNAPDVYFIKDGRIVGNHQGIVDNYINFQQELTEDQKKELIQIYQSNYDKIFANVCVEEAC